MTSHLKNNLIEIQSLIKQLSDEQYQVFQEVLSGASIGQHVRHILEFYTCLFSELVEGKVCYDKRERDTRIENNRDFAIDLIQQINSTLTKITYDVPLKLTFSFGSDEKSIKVIGTSLYRELAYNFEHSIHHQALIKIGVNALSVNNVINDNFGIAPATIKYRQEQCAQ